MRPNIIRRGLFNFLKGTNIENILVETPKVEVEQEKKISDVHYPVHLDTTIKLIKTHIYSKQEAMDAENPKSLLDCTLGTGGHAKFFLDAFPNLHILGIDLDKRMVDYVNQNIRETLSPENKNRLFAMKSNFTQADNLSPFQAFPEVFHKKDKFNVILADLGYNSLQLAGGEWGLSYNTAQALDMRYDSTMSTTASDLVNEAPAFQLKEIFAKFGEEPAAEQVAKIIVQERQKKKIETTQDLKKVIFENLSPRADKYKILMRIFQALRIAINNELDNLETFMEKVMTPLKQDGIGIIITFHSLERQIVTNTIKNLKRKNKILIVENSLPPSEEEVNINSRSKSARLHCFQKLIP